MSVEMTGFMILSPPAGGETLPRAIYLGKGLEVFSQRGHFQTFFTYRQNFIYTITLFR